MIIDLKNNTPAREWRLEFLMLIVPFALVFNLVVFCLCVAAVVSLAATGAIFGWVVAGSIPVWASILMWVMACSI